MRRGLRRPSLVAGCVLLAGLPVARAVELAGRIEHLTSEDWRLGNVELSLTIDAGSPAAKLRIGRLELPEAGLTLDDIRLECGRIELGRSELACLDAVVDVDLPGIDRGTFPGSLRYARTTGEARFELRNVAVAGGRLRVEGSAAGDRLELYFAGEDLELPGLAVIAGQFAPGFGDTVPAAGVVEVSGSLASREEGELVVSLAANVAGASVGNDAGTMVAEAVDGRLELDGRLSAGGWRFTTSVAATGGEAYFEPVYADFSRTPLIVAASGTVAPDLDGVSLASLSLTQGNVVELAAELDVRLPQADGEAPAATGTIELADSSLDAIYTGLLQVFAAGTALGELDTSGTVSGLVRLTDNRVTDATVTIRELRAEDRRGRFAVHGMNGVLHWPGAEGEPEAARASRLRWESGSVHTIPLGAGMLEAALGGNDLLMLEPLRVPVLGGALLVNRLEIRNYGQPEASGTLDAELEPLELGRLTAAFGWPAFSGLLSGRLPSLQYENETMRVGGSLTAKAFGGDIELANLALEQPFGLVPRLTGDLRLRQLDLERVTDTFSFGLIQGRLSGDVTGLDMIGWRPVAMDLHLYTPQGDTSRRRISQRAVENLASVGGGGAAAALSSGFMKFFEVFAYERIGIRCILADGVCRMSGAGPARESELGAGYFIVKGSGVPRIDVVGYRQRVSWTQLLNQLAAIMETGSPTVN